MLVLLPAGAASAGEPAAPQPMAIEHVTVIDTAGGSALQDGTVLIRDGRIERIGKSGEVAIGRGMRVVDGRGRFLIPGLWDMHVHLSWTTSSALPVLLATGVTGVRDMGGRLGEIDAWRTRIDAGLLAGPRIVRAGPILNGRSFNPLQLAVATPEEARGIARALKHVGVDFIKTHRRMPRDGYFALVDETKKLGLPLVGHVPMTVTPEEASDAGQATLEHTETLFEGTFSVPLKEGELSGAIARFRAEAADALFARFVKNGTFVTPTLVAYRSTLEAVDPSLPTDPRARYVASSLKREASRRVATETAPEIADVKRTFAELIEVVRQMRRDGVTLLAGSDVAGPRIPGFSLHDELALLVEAGSTPLQALQAATLNPARLLGKLGDYGAVQPGRVADLVLLDGNPLEDIRNTTRIASVVVGGRYWPRPELDALLAEGERLALQN